MHSTYWDNFLAEARAKRKRSKISIAIEWTAIILLSGWLGVALFYGLSNEAIRLGF